MNSLSKIIARYFSILYLTPILVALTGCGTAQYTYQDGTSASTNGAPAITGTPVSVPTSEAGSQTNRGPDVLRTGDRINVSFSGLPVPVERHEEQIREDGYFNPPFLGRAIKAAGKRIGELQEELQKLYVPDYFKSATITVRRQDSYFFVGGEVKSSGMKPYLSEMTVLKAIQTAGDFTEFSKKTKIQVIRANGHKEKPVNYNKAINNPKLDLPIFPGDTIIVPKRYI